MVENEEITEAEYNGALKFTIRNAAGKYLDKDGNLSDEKVELTLKDGGFVKGEDGRYTKTFKNVAIGKYTFTETKSDINGYDLVSKESTITGEATVVAGKTAKIDLVEVYEKKLGDLIIRKTVGGDVTKEEVEKAALKFEVKTSDGKWLDKDGKVCDTKVELTLGEADGFVTKDGGKTWIKTFKDVPADTYTVTETNSLIEGFKLADSSETEATAEVKAGDEATAELTDEYEKKSEVSTDKNKKDDKKPSKGVDTGDDTPFTAWITLMLTSLAGLIASVFTRRRTDRK